MEEPIYYQLPPRQFPIGKRFKISKKGTRHPPHTLLFLLWISKPIYYLRPGTFYTQATDAALNAV